MGGGGSSQVQLLAQKPGGKALFLVSPSFRDGDCTEPVSMNGEASELNCKSAYLVSCDATQPSSQPLCTLVREVGNPRYSSYPGNRR